MPSPRCAALSFAPPPPHPSHRLILRFVCPPFAPPYPSLRPPYPQVHRATRKAERLARREGDAQLEERLEAMASQPLASRAARHFVLGAADVEGAEEEAMSSEGTHARGSIPVDSPCPCSFLSRAQRTSLVWEDAAMINDAVDEDGEPIESEDWL